MLKIAQTVLLGLVLVKYGNTYFFVNVRLLKITTIANYFLYIFINATLVHTF